MKKYLTIIKVTWQRALTYRFTVFTYRVGEVLEMLALIFMWSAIFGEQELIRGFTLHEMITYILLGNLANVLVRNMLPSVVARDIKDGQLSIFLIRPIQYFEYILAREVGRISLATFMSAVSQLLIIFFFFSKLVPPASSGHLLIIGLMLPLAFVTELLISYLVGLIAFWTEEVDGLHLSLERLKKFFAGGYFPLNLLPTTFAQLSYLLPFAYSFFVPAQLYLGKIDVAQGLKGLAIQLIWIFLLYVIIQLVWKAGLKRYEGVGI